VDVIQMLKNKQMKVNETYQGYSLYQVQGTEERKMEPNEKVLLVMENMLGIDATTQVSNPRESANDKIGRFIFKRETQQASPFISLRRSRKMTLEIRKKRREQAKAYQSKTYSFVGSPHYMAPEILKKRGYDQNCDWWSIGAVAYEMLIGFPPFYGETPQEVFGNILDHEKTLEFPDPEEEGGISPSAIDFLKKLLTSVEHRLGSPDANELRDHPFLHEINWEILRDYPNPPFMPKLSSETDLKYFSLNGARSSGEQFLGNENRAANNVEMSERSYDFLGFTYKPNSFMDSQIKMYREAFNANTDSS